MGYTENLIDFIGKSTDCYHAVKTAKDRLDENGFKELLEGDKWDVQSGGKYYVIRNSSSIIAFEMPKKDFGAFMICASHTDSPSFKLKPDFEINADGCIKLSVEGYGGMIMSSWLDRPLSISGRIVTAKDGKVETKLVNIDRDLLVIPSLAIHMSRDINKGYEFNIRRDMCPIASEKNGRIEDIIAENVGVDKDEILGFDLSLYNRRKSRSTLCSTMKKSAAVQSKVLNRHFCVMCLKEFAIIRKRTKEPLLKALCYRATMLMRCIRILRTSRTVQTVCI